MIRKGAALSWWLAGACSLGIALLLAAAATGLAQNNGGVPARISFQISTGSTSGSDFSVGELLAGLLSHPPGISRCEAADLCGPPGLIVSTRATEGSVANVVAVNSGTTNSGLAQADVVALAAAGQGPFARTGAARQLRVIADLYGQALHLVAANEAKIINVPDLRGKRVSLSTEGSGTIVTARAVLAAYRLAEWRLVASYDPVDIAVEKLRAGQLDAFFFVGGTPVDIVEQLLEEGIAVLIPIDGAARDRLLAGQRYLDPYTIPQDVYAGTPTVDTVSVPTLWITGEAQSADLVYSMVKAVYNPRNRPMIEARNTGSDFLEVELAAEATPAPLHPGALRYYTEAHLVGGPVIPAMPLPKPAL